MLRIIGGVVLGYVSMAAVVFAGLTGAYLALGADRAFQSGLYDVSAVWVAISLVVGLGAALLGGWVARRVSRTARGPWLLAGLIVVLGAGLAVAALLGEPAATGARTGALGPFDAMQQATTPIWVMLLNPVVGAIGALVGGGAMGAPQSSEPAGAAAPGGPG